MKVLTINFSDSLGGAAGVATGLHHAFLKKGIDSSMLVGVSSAKDPGIHTFDSLASQHRFKQIVLDIAQSISPYHGRIRGAWRLTRFLQAVAEPGKFLNRNRGIEDFEFPATYHILNHRPRPDILHCHNLHGGYFDLRALSWLSKQLPVVLTLHDAWLLSGHCAHSLDCERWKTGCGNCPYLEVYPAVRKDNTAHNWARKKQIYEDCKLYVTTPSNWLLKKVKESILNRSILETRVIPNGVDIETFQPGDRNAARNRLKLPSDSWVIVSIGHQLRSNLFKDFATLTKAFQQIAERHPKKEMILLIAGDSPFSEQISAHARIRCDGYTFSLQTLIDHYQAADLYMQASVAETFPGTILEAQSCAIPVVSTAVGGVPEQIEDGRSGILIPIGNSNEMASAAEKILMNADVSKRLATGGRESVVNNFSLEKQVQRYLDWFHEIISQQKQDPQ